MIEGDEDRKFAGAGSTASLLGWLKLSLQKNVWSVQASRFIQITILASHSFKKLHSTNSSMGLYHVIRLELIS
jgi:hypothetical protein